jgi:hypothetical protein
MAKTPTATAEANDEGVQEALFVFEGTNVEEQLVALLGCAALKISDTLEQGDEVVIEVRGKVQQSRVVTKQRGDRAGGREVTRVVRVVKVDDGKIVRSIPRLVK